MKLKLKWQRLLRAMTEDIYRTTKPIWFLVCNLCLLVREISTSIYWGLDGKHHPYETEGGCYRQVRVIWVNIGEDICTYNISKTFPCNWLVLVWIVTSTSICWGMFREMTSNFNDAKKWRNSTERIRLRYTPGIRYVLVSNTASTSKC